MGVLKLVARETPPVYRPDNLDERLERIERTLADIAERMATKSDLEELRKEMATKAALEQVNQAMATRVALESVQDDIRKVADGYATISQRLEYVANLLKPPAFR